MGKFRRGDVEDAAESIASSSTHTPTPEKETRLYLPSGSTLLNLACSGRGAGAYPAGRYTHIVGDSHAGKTVLALSAFAEASIDSRFNDYEFDYDDAEAANLFDLRAMFGPRMADRLQAPGKDGRSMSRTMKDFKLNVMRKAESRKKFIYVLDSFDAICSDEELDILDDELKDKEAKGSRGQEKAKSIGATLRMICSALEASESYLFIVSQTRDNCKPGSFNPKTHSGGRALKFYACIQYWLTVAGAIKRTVHGRTRVIGNNVEAYVTKSKVTGKVRHAGFPIYGSYGIDDVQSSVEWMMSEKFWRKTGQTITAPELDFQGTQEKLIAHIEREGLEKKLRKAVRSAWGVVEEDMKIARKPKYT